MKYIDRALEPLGCTEITSSMVSNYVKKGYIARPEKKLYRAEQIGRLFIYAICKLVLPMEHIMRLNQYQEQQGYRFEVAYDAFCDELERSLREAFGLEAAPAPTKPLMEGQGADMLRGVVGAVTNVIYLNAAIARLDEEK